MPVSPPPPSAPSRPHRALAIAALLLLGAGLAWWLSIRPSNHRPWSADQDRLPEITIAGSRVHIRNVRNFTYESVDRFTPRWEERSYDLDHIVRAWFVVEPFGDWRGPAHTFVSFEFEGPRFLAISVEVRKEVGERFSPWLGLLKRYELAYVVGDERDLIGLRANHRRDTVHVYPVRASRERVRAVFLQMLERANRLRDHPEFYNTLTNNCTTNIVDHVNALAPGRVPPSWKVLLPGYADELAHDIGLLDTDLPLDAARRRFIVNDRARRYADAPDFSVRIRRTDR